ncbi:hypothetical protein B5G52_04170 [Pseudoalteromonas sp. A601]|uniref:hypothetical protein n=1 Tax=Pseudoalteromonas sp. A601 TaxID=1967839 RepID=UPI000B3BDF5D|nr:hypothetical protein [Pseudoalteromonas sp. A601]OUS73449.1 hypothetical protein B5G52_04170 [Pseudoalteromonas sp. A601]
MINLKELEKHQRIKLARKLDKFFITYSQNKNFNNTYEAIKSKLSNQPLKNKLTKYAPEIWTLICATTKAIKYDSDGVYLPRDKVAYKTANSFTGKKVSFTRMKELTSLLDELGLLTVYVGFTKPDSVKKYYRGTEQGMMSAITFSDEWLNMFDVEKARLFGTAREFDLVVMKDSKGNIIPTKGMRGIKEEKALLKDWNTTLNATKITIDGAVVKPVYIAVYNGLGVSGRCFAGSFSTECHDLRPTITINDNPTCEVDYKNMHIRVLYNEHGIDFQDDAYEIKCPDLWCAKELRTAAKRACLIMLNSSSMKEAISALRGDLNMLVKPKTFKATDNNIKYIFSELQRIHTPIQEHFFKGEWGRLQNIDSRVLKQVVKVFNCFGVPVLTYHDSFVVESRYKNLLVKSMKEAWEIVLGDNKGFAYDVEYDAAETATRPANAIITLGDGTRVNAETGEVLDLKRTSFTTKSPQSNKLPIFTDCVKENERSQQKPPNFIRSMTA